MTGHDWFSYPATVVTRLEWSYSFDFFWFAIAASGGLFLLSLRNRRSLISALVLLAGGLSWYYVMFQHTHIHPFVGQYSFMAICPIFGLIVSEMLFFTRRSLRRAADRSKSVGTELVTAALLLAALWAMVWPYLQNTYGLIHKTAEIAKTVQMRYAAAIEAICQQHPQITLDELEAASRDWGFAWRPRLITETNRTPTCPEQPIRRS
jgi:hypothetical protein